LKFTNASVLEQSVFAVGVDGIDILQAVRVKVTEDDRLRRRARGLSGVLFLRLTPDRGDLVLRFTPDEPSSREVFRE
jgi:hypothetical protein